MAGPSAADPSGRREHLYQVNVMRKCDLLLQPEDGDGEGEAPGCLPCVPGCRKPVYAPGHVVCGHLLLRPTRRITITGFTVTFGGRYETSWTEGLRRWSSCRVFFSETYRIIENRYISLDCKWYRFDFEYPLPHGLPTSFKEADGRVLYYAYGTVHRPDGPQIETYDAHYSIRGKLDIAKLPPYFHESVVHRKLRKCCSGNFVLLDEQYSTDSESCDRNNLVGNNSSVCGDVSSSDSVEGGGIVEGGMGEVEEGERSENGRRRYSGFPMIDDDGEESSVTDCQQRVLPQDNGDNEMNGMAGEDCSEPEWCDAGVGVEQGPVPETVEAVIRLNSQAFVIKEQAIMADVSVCNRTAAPLVCSVRFQQVITFEAHAGKEDRGKHEPTHYLTGSHVKTLERNVCNAAVVRVAPLATEVYTAVFDIPPVMPSSPTRLHLSRPDTLRNDTPLIAVKYFLVLDVRSHQGGSGFCIPQEVTLGTRHSGTRQVSLRVAGGPDEPWYGPPDCGGLEGPPSYEETSTEPSGEVTL